MSTNMYVKFSNGIKGEAEDKDHSGWCEITALEQDFTQDASPTEDSDQDTSKAEHGEIKISKLVDEASTKLMKACWEGTKLDKVEIECYRAANVDQPIKYFTVKLEDAIISKFEYKASEGEIISEDLELTAAKATYTYQAMDKKLGTEKGQMIASHDLKSNVIS
jgi:type VI secretion system secreted protein Hcp